MVTHSVTMLEKHLVFSGEPPSRNFATSRVKKRSIKPEDPMSHRIIEKRRRDRMNNCLADLSRLIPPEYLKKGRGRIEKTEIIEMAIKHMRHLQNIIASSRFNEISDNSMPSPPATSAASKEPAIAPGDQPVVVEHYRLGYLECLSEAMHFLVEVQGYFAGDSLCVQMINHLHEHCDKILKGNGLNLAKKQSGETGSDSSRSPANGTFNNSPPLLVSNSTGSASDDTQPGQTFEVGKPFEDFSRSLRSGSPRKYAEPSYPKNPDAPYPRYLEREGADHDNRSDSETHQNFIFKCRNNEIKRDESKSYLNGYENAVNFGGRNYQVPNGTFHAVEDSSGFETASAKEENGNGPSQLREMLTSPSSVSAQLNGHANKATSEAKGNTSPLSSVSGCESSSGHLQCVKSSAAGKSLGFKCRDPSEPPPDFSEMPPDNHHMMYKFKNNIKQRFSKEKRENPECDLDGDNAQKRQKRSEDYLKFPDPLMKERLNLLDRTEPEEEKLFKFNADFEAKKRIRYVSESEILEGDISNRLSFGHKSTEKGKKWEETMAGLRYHNNPKLWSLSPSGSVAFFGSQVPLGCKPPLRQIPDCSSAASNSFNNISMATSESGPGIPIFALHAKGSFYIPLTLDHATLAPFLTLLGITKTDEEVPEKTVLHPVTISVNFQSHLVR